MFASIIPLALNIGGGMLSEFGKNEQNRGYAQAAAYNTAVLRQNQTIIKQSAE